MEKTLSYEKPAVKLVGQDGNAFSILGRVKSAMKDAGATKEEIDQMLEEATSGDYNHLLTTVMEYVNEASFEEDEDECCSYCGECDCSGECQEEEEDDEDE